MKPKNLTSLTHKVLNARASVVSFLLHLFRFINSFLALSNLSIYFFDVAN